MNSKSPFSPERWERTPLAVQAYLRALEARVAALEATVEQLREQLQQDSRTSSRPPSSDPPQALAKRPRREPTGRRPGGQPGHEAHARLLVPSDQADVVVPVKPERCRRCQHPLQGEDRPPQRHQVTDIPPIRPVVTEYQLHRLVCPVCGAATRAEWPAGVPAGGFGPRVQANTARCTGAYHVSTRTTQSVLDDLFGVSLGLGSVAHLEPATAQAVAEPVAAARAYVQAEPVAYADETGWREGQHRAWLWTVVTAWVTGFAVRRSRRGQVARELMGEQCWGWLVTDRWSAYPWYPTWRRQLCWAHLLRDLEAMIARGGGSAETGEALRAQARQMFQWWHRGRDGTLAPASFVSYRWPVRQEVERLLEAGQTCGVPKTVGTCRQIFRLRQALWTFVRHPEVGPTNNAAERAIRPGVLWRKGSFGTQSAAGSRFVEAMMTVAATLTQQHRQVLDYLTTACEAALHREPAPSVLPSPGDREQLLCPAAECAQEGERLPDIKVDARYRCGFYHTDLYSAAKMPLVSTRQR
jgi:transposase